MSATKHASLRVAATSSPRSTGNLARRESVGHLSVAEYKATKTKTRSKYGNKKTWCDGIKFDSKHEADRYVQLRNLKNAGAIDRLELQVRYDFQINGVKLGFYKADFRYLEMERGYAVRLVVEDAKGMPTPVYRLKKKLMKAIYAIEVRET